MAVIALDLGGTKLAGAIFTRRGKMLYQTAVPLARRRGRAAARASTARPVTGSIQGRLICHAGSFHGRSARVQTENTAQTMDSEGQGAPW